MITKDKNLWTSCPVLEMSDDELKNSNEGQMEKFNMRFAPSVDKEGNPIAGSMGLGWFPGYAINMETGDRLARAFAADRYLGGANGRDMIWKSNDKVYPDKGH